MFIVAGAAIYRAMLVIRARGSKDGEAYIALLRQDPDITVEKIV